MGRHSVAGARATKAPTARIRPRRRMFGLAVGLIDQGVSSLGSLLVIAIVARFSPVDVVGDFSLGLTTALAVQSIARAVCGETIILRSRDGAGRQEERFALAVSLGISTLGAILSLAIATLWREQAEVFASAALCAVGLTLFDALRYTMIAREDSRRLLLLDIVFVATGLTAVSLCGRSGMAAPAFLAAWALSGLAIALTGLLVFRISPAFHSAWRWLKSVWRQSSAFAAEAISGAITGWVTTAVIALVATAADVAVFRTSITVFGVTSVAVNFLRSTYMRSIGPEKLRTWPGIAQLSGVMSLLVATSIGFTVSVFLLIGDDTGQRLLGDTWRAVGLVLVPVSINRLLAGMSIIPLIILRVTGVSWEAARVRVIIGFAGIALGSIGAAAGGAAGALYGESVTYLLITCGLSVLLWTRPRGISPVPT